MKVQVNAGALLAACERYISAMDIASATQREDTISRLMRRQTIKDPPTLEKYSVKTGWWIFGATEEKFRFVYHPERTVQRTREEAEEMVASNIKYFPNHLPSCDRAKLFRDIAKHKNPNTLLELTDAELDGIAPYLAPFNDPNGRIE